VEVCDVPTRRCQPGWFGATSGVFAVGTAISIYGAQLIKSKLRGRAGFGRILFTACLGLAPAGLFFALTFIAHLTVGGAYFVHASPALALTVISGVIWFGWVFRSELQKRPTLERAWQRKLAKYTWVKKPVGNSSTAAQDEIRVDVTVRTDHVHEEFVLSFKLQEETNISKRDGVVPVTMKAIAGGDERQYPVDVSVNAITFEEARPRVRVVSSPKYPGGVELDISGFPPNSKVTIQIVGDSRTYLVDLDKYGNGKGTLTLEAKSGTREVVASDDDGHEARRLF